MTLEIDGEIKARLEQANNVLVTSHVRPDGDAIGSLIGLGLALQQAGKKIQMVLADGVSANFRHLEGAAQVATLVDLKFDTFITVDCADFNRTGKPFEKLGQPDINIDHHITNEKFGKLNLIEGEAVATAAILTNHIPRWGLAITQPVASAFLTGIISDTLGFRTSNTTPEALRQAAQLMEYGVDMSELYMRALVSRSFSSSRYWGKGLAKLEQKNGIVWTSLSLSDRKAAGYGGNDDADLINVISSIDGNKVGIIFVEQTDNHVKVSWRAMEAGINVARVAKHFNGGGHAAAAGADIPGGLSEVRDSVLRSTRELLNI